MPTIYHNHERTSTFFAVKLNLRLRLNLLVAIILLTKSSYTVMGFARSSFVVNKPAKNPILKTTPISDARYANTSSSVRFSVKLQSTTYNDRINTRP
eukprot:scaffold3431_cov219-Skeletonema_menzelii.AAC.4